MIAPASPPNPLKGAFDNLPPSGGSGGAKGLLADFLGQPLKLVDHFLNEQQSLTAVDRFSTFHDETATGRPGQERYYSDLLPLREPVAGEQFAFEVNLDRCSGCKACVTACHSLNGLDEDETWRSVGLLHDASQSRMQQHVTTACHHCLEPTCAQGCPTLAYAKDAVTGIVRHLDDQCFGCQYCILKCPYEVPQYNKKKGIVRKCDMCIGRLRAGEAPACVQACPTQAIRIVLVEKETLRVDPNSSFGLPGTPDANITVPTTRYTTDRGLNGVVPIGAQHAAPRQVMQAVDAFQIRTEHAHAPLVFMLVTSQMACGFWIIHAIHRLLKNGAAISSPVLELTGLGLVLMSLALSLLHLGRPLLAWKAFLGWRRSWLSREVIAFSALAGSATATVLISIGTWIDRTLPPSQPTLFSGRALISSFLILTACTALTALYASAMVYRDTPRPLWATRKTFWKFTLSAFLCGAAAYLVVNGKNQILTMLLPPAMLIKLALEARVLRHRDDEDPNPLWKAAQLLTTKLGAMWRFRVTLGLIGGVALPILSVMHVLSISSFGIIAWPLLITVLITGGELLERTLFFLTGIGPRMPGGR